MGQRRTPASTRSPYTTLFRSEAVSLTLTDVELFAGVGGSLNANGTPDDFSNDTVVNGSLGFRGEIDGDLRVVAIQDGTDSYLALESDADVLSADLIGLGALLEFHAWDATVRLNAFGGTASAKLDWDSLATSGLPLASLTVDETLDLHVDGNVALNALSGTLVAVGEFNLDVGQVSTTADNGTAGISFVNADAVSLTLTDVELFAGVGGSLNANGTPTDFSDDTVVSGTLGFRGAIDGDLSVVAIQDGSDSYLALESDADVLSADLIGLGALLEFHAWDATVRLNAFGGTASAKLDWDSLATSGLPLASLTVDETLDLHVDGNVALNALSGTLVAVGAFNLDVGQVSTTADNGAAGISFVNAEAVSLTLTDVELFAGVGGSLNANGTPDDFSNDTVVNGSLGFRGEIDGDLSVVAIQDGSDSYLALESDADVLSPDLIGLGALHEFPAWEIGRASR